MAGINSPITLTEKNQGTSVRFGQDRIIDFYLDPISPKTGTFIRYLNNDDYPSVITVTETPTQVLLAAENCIALTDVSTTATFYVNVDRIVNYYSDGGTGSILEYDNLGTSNRIMNVTASPSTIATAMAGVITEITVTQTTAIVATVSPTAPLILSSKYNEIATANTAAPPYDSVQLPIPVRAGQEVIIRNNGTEQIDVFPGTGDQIDGAGANVAFQLLSAATRTFVNDGVSSANWITY